MAVLKFSFDHVADRLHDLNETVPEPIVPDNLREDFDIFLRIMEAKDGREIADIPVEAVLGLFDNLDALVACLNLDNDYTPEHLKKAFGTVNTKKCRVL